MCNLTLRWIYKWYLFKNTYIVLRYSHTCLCLDDLLSHIRDCSDGQTFNFDHLHDARLKVIWSLKCSFNFSYTKHNTWFSRRNRQDKLILTIDSNKQPNTNKQTTQTIKSPLVHLKQCFKIEGLSTNFPWLRLATFLFVIIIWLPI